jgi:hypothetical protein
LRAASVSVVVATEHTLGPDKRDSLLTKRMFSGFKSVCTSFNLCKTAYVSVPPSPVPLRVTSLLTLYTLQQTPRKALDVLFWEGLEPVYLEEVEHAHAVQLRDQTWMVAEVKVLCEMDALAVGSASVLWLALTMRWTGRSS